MNKTLKKQIIWEILLHIDPIFATNKFNPGLRTLFETNEIIKQLESNIEKLEKIAKAERRRNEQTKNEKEST